MRVNDDAIVYSQMGIAGGLWARTTDYHKGAELRSLQANLMSIPRSRDAPRGGTDCRYFEIERL
jgi:hypothetical protein